MKTIDTLVPDMKNVLLGLGGWDAALTKYLSETIAEVASNRFSEPQAPRGYLSMSSLGDSCDRSLWYKVNKPELSEPLDAEALGTFFYGDIIEAFALALAKAAGHKVEGEQTQMNINGIKGHRDAVIDGMTVDVKSASPFGFKKFKEGTLRSEDSFGYISQLSSYVFAGKDDPLVVDKERGAFLAIRKDRFDLALDIYDFSEDLPWKEAEVERKKALVEGDIPSERLKPIPQSKTSKNTKLPIKCGYCSFRETCWPEARTFIYSSGPVFLVDVKNEPKVPEVT